MLVRRRRYFPVPVAAGPRSIIRKLWWCQLSLSVSVKSTLGPGLVWSRHNNNNNKQQQTTTNHYHHSFVTATLVKKDNHCPLERILWSSTLARILQPHQLYTASLLRARSCNNVADCAVQSGTVSDWQLWGQCHPAAQQSQSVLTGYFIATKGSHRDKINFSSPTFWSRLRDSTRPTLTTMSPSSPPQMMRWTHFPGPKMRTFYFITWVGLGNTSNGTWKQTNEKHYSNKKYQVFKKCHFSFNVSKLRTSVIWRYWDKRHL